MITQRGMTTHEYAKTTINKKFDVFIDEMVRLNFSNSQMKTELVKYMQDIETGYSSLVRKYKGLYRQALELAKKQKRKDGAVRDATLHL